MFSMKMLIFGSRGYLGAKLLAQYPDAAAPRVDIADPVAVAATLDAEKPDVVINAAGKTGRPNVDWCETHREETLRSNLTGPLVLLEECGKRGIYWVHLGSGCIYAGDNGGRGFTENDPPNFTGSFYSRTKKWSDEVLREFPDGWSCGGGLLNLRLRMPFEGGDNPRNLLTKLRGYRRVLDVPNSLTFIPDFLSALSLLLEKRATGTYNVVAPGALSPYRIMELYREIVDPSHAFERLTIEDLSDVVRAARSNCILSPAKLLAEGVTLRTAEEAVGGVLEGMKSRIPA